MGARLRLVLPAWTGSVLVAVGFLAFVVSYFLLPLYFTACFDTCTAGTFSATTWEFTLNSLSAWKYWVNALPHFDISLVPDTFVLALCYLPLLAAVTVVGWSAGFLLRPRRTLAIWSNRAWLVGSIALGIMLLLDIAIPLMSLVHPDIGFFGMLVGYGLLWAGNHIFLTVQP